MPKTNYRIGQIVPSFNTTGLKTVVPIAGSLLSEKY